LENKVKGSGNEEERNDERRKRNDEKWQPSATSY
jgi:hypothetical protein